MTADRSRARPAASGRPRAGVGFRRTRLDVSARVARARSPAVPDPAGGVPSRPRAAPESVADAAYVRRRAGAHGLACHVRTPASRPVPGDSIERWAREERHRAATRRRRRDRRRPIGARPHPRRSRRDRAARPAARLGSRRAHGDRTRGRPAGAPAARRSSFGDARVLPRARLAPATRSVERRHVAACATRSACEVLPTLAAATGRDVAPTIARTRRAASCRCGDARRACGSVSAASAVERHGGEVAFRVGCAD